MEGISTKIVRGNLNVFATFLVKDINSCIKNGEFVDNLETDEMTPAFKKGDKHDKSNYRPLSILPILSKVYEKCLYKETKNYMENILSEIQYSFKKALMQKSALQE